MNLCCLTDQLVVGCERFLEDESQMENYETEKDDEPVEVISSSMFDDYTRSRSMEVSYTASLSSSQQVNKYLTMPASQCNPVKFWLEERAGLDRLKKYALSLLTVPATSAPVERVFSAGGLLMRPHRASMSDKTLSDLIFLKCNRP